MKIRKYDFWAVGSLLAALLVLVCVSASVRAEPLSQHNEEQASKNAAIKLLHDKGCTFPYLARSGQFKLYDNGDKTADIAGYNVHASCLEWRTAVPVVTAGVGSVGAVLITFNDPTTRANGAPLTDAEISGFNIYRSTSAAGPFTSVAMVANDTASTVQSITLSGIGAGAYFFTLTTIDKSGLESAQSAVLSVTVK